MFDNTYDKLANLWEKKKMSLL